MNKTELVEYMAVDADISKAEATRAIDSALARIKSTLRRGGQVQIKGFGTFGVGKRAARTVRNPRNGQPIKVRAKKVPTFKAGTTLKEAVK